MTFWLTVVMLCWVFFDAPHLAWGEHIAESYDSRTRTFAVRSFICNIGALIFYALPLLPIFPTRDVNLDTLRCAQTLSYILWAPIVYVTLRYVPNANGPTVSRHESIVGSLRLVMSNRPFRLLLGITVLRTIAEAMWGSVAYLAFDYYYGLGSKLAMMYFVSLLISAVSASPLTRMTAAMGKRRTLLVLQGMFIGLVAVPIVIQPNWEFTYVVLLGVLAAVLVICFCNGVVTNAILADTIDYGRWKHGTSQAAGYFAVLAFFGQIAGGVGGSFALGIMGHMGFSAKGVTNMTEARHGLQVVFFLLPVLITVLTLAFVAKLPICARRAALIRRRIEFRAKVIEGCSAAE
jgi:GPH family glycoside/pentoside/hexuronide:cation symporter